MKLKQVLWRRQNSVCPWCGKKITVAQYPDATRDHIISRSHGGPSVLANMQLMHGYCNKAKADLCPICGRLSMPKDQRVNCWQQTIHPYGSPAAEVPPSLPFAKWR